MQYPKTSRSCHTIKKYQSITHGELLDSIQVALVELGKTIDSVTIEDLAPVDEFHIGGRLVTEHLFKQLNFPEHSHILDVGCGLGGTSRFVANKYSNLVTGIDLTQEYIDVGTTLCEWVGLDKQVTLHQGSALDMPFEDKVFDGAFMLHVGMNINDKARLFTEMYRVLRSDASLGIYDVMQINDGVLAYPVPWATEASTSRLATPDHYVQSLIQAGFKVSNVSTRGDFALDFFKQMHEKMATNKGALPLGLHTLMQESTTANVKNMIENIAAGFLAPVEIIGQK